MQVDIPKKISKEVILGLLARRANNSPLKRERKAQYHSNFKILNQKSWSSFFYSRQPKREELSTFKDANEWKRSLFLPWMQ